MFVQVMRAQVRDPDGVRRVFDRWDRDLRQGADGFLGCTSGITPDGELVAVARFENVDLAERNSARPEQDVWFEELCMYLDGEPTFTEATEVDLLLDGGAQDAGFVQVMRGRADDKEGAREAMAEMAVPMRAARPDVLGGLLAWHGGNDFTEVVYFTSEEEARKGEASVLPERLQEPLARAAMHIDEYLDLPRPVETTAGG
jgi:hypothetical protein